MEYKECIRALQAYKQEQSAIWGNVDDLVVARYLAGESTSEERKVVEQEMGIYPRLADCIKHIQKVLYGRSQ